MNFEYLCNTNDTYKNNVYYNCAASSQYIYSVFNEGGLIVLPLLSLSNIFNFFYTGYVEKNIK